MADKNAVSKSMLNQMGSPSKASIIPTPMHPGAEVNKAHKSDWFSTWQKRIVTRVAEALKRQDFGPEDSQIVSALMNPKEAINRSGDWFRHNASVASGGDPYDNPNPLIGSNRSEQAEAGLNLAGLAQLGGMPGAPSSAGGTLGTFIGPKAKGWYAKKAELAKQLLDSGVPPQQVWKEHLIGKMPDGSLFSEINDRNFTLNHPDELIQAGKYSGWKEDAMNHPALFQEYPQFEYDPLQMKIGRGKSGHYDSIDNMTFAAGKTPEDIANVLLHENQHAIQGVEGWSTGGSPSNTPGFDIDAVMRIKDHVKRLGIKPDDIEARLRAGQPVSLAEQERYHKYLGLIEQEKEIYSKGITNEEAYRRLTGEAQARLTQDRQNLTMQQRAEQYPLEGDKVADIPFNQLINRYGGSGDQRSLPETEFSQAHKIAQEHAALPVEQGGLGLPLDNTAMDRALALGFESGHYKGMYPYDWTKEIGDYPGPEITEINRTSLFPAFNGDEKGVKIAGFTTRDIDVANRFADSWPNSKGAVYPLMIKKGIEKTIDANNKYAGDIQFGDEGKEFRDIIRNGGIDALNLNNTLDEGNVKVVLNPSIIRARFAAFDPFKKDSANILASVLLGTTLASQQDKK